MLQFGRKCPRGTSFQRKRLSIKGYHIIMCNGKNLKHHNIRQISLPCETCTFYQAYVILISRSCEIKITLVG